MKRHAIGIAAALALLCQQDMAVADPKRDIVSANYVMPGCWELVSGSHRELGLQGLCSGIVGMMFNFEQLHPGTCFPDGSNVEQAIRVVIRYIDRQPERMHESFVELALEAMREAWPCRR